MRVDGECVRILLMPLKKVCVYCGTSGVKMTRDHVFPRGLFPSGGTAPGVNRLTVPACKECNNSFADDEAHFRAVMTLAGPTNESSQSVWEEGVLRSLYEKDGKRRITDLWSIMEHTTVDDADRLKIYPAKDPRVLRVIKKCVRALSYKHFGVAILEDQVWADVLKYSLPAEYEAEVLYMGDEPGVVEYAYVDDPVEDIERFWLIRFFGRTTFIASVSISNLHPATT